jgi:hypothetical protein
MIIIVDVGNITAIQTGVTQTIRCDFSPLGLPPLQFERKVGCLMNKFFIGAESLLPRMNAG